MEVNTKYKNGDSIFLLLNSTIKKATINEFRVIVNCNSKVQVVYNVVIIGGPNTLISVEENSAFDTKVEAAYSWLKNQELNPREVLQGFLNQEQEQA
jgi:hypothetical protein